MSWQSARERGLLARATIVGLAVALVAGCSSSATSAPPASAPPASAGASTAGGACNPAGFPSGQINLSAWTGTDTPGDKLMTELVNQYQTLHPNVHIDKTPTSTNDILTKLLVSLPAGSAQPQMTILFSPYMTVFTQPGYLAPVVPAAMCASSMQDVIDRYVPGSLDPFMVNGSVYALPNQENGWSLLINNKAFEAAGFTIPNDIPKTWDQLAAMQPKLKKVDSSGKVTQVGFEYRYNSGDQWYSMMFVGLSYQEGAPVVDSTGKVVLNSPEQVAAATEWAKNIVAPSISKNTGPSPYQDFADGLDVMSFGGPNALSFVEQLNPALKGNVTVASLPSTGKAFTGAQTYAFGYGVNKNASADEQFVTWNFINFALSDPNLWFTRTGNLQPVKGWYDQPAAQGFEGLQTFVHDLQNGKPLPQTPHWAAVQTAVKNAIQRIVFEGADPKASLDQAQQEYDQATK